MEVAASPSGADGAARARIEAPPGARTSGALGDLVEGMGLEAVRLAVDLGRGLAIRGVDEAEDLAGLLVDAVVLVVDAVRALDARRRRRGRRRRPRP